MNVTQTADEKVEGCPIGCRCQNWKYQVSPGWMLPPGGLGKPWLGPPVIELLMSTDPVPPAPVLWMSLM